MRETVIGTLHVVRTRKRYGSPMADYIARILEEDRPDTIRWYPPIYWVETEKRDYTGRRAFMYRFKGQPKALEPEMEGYDITVRATMEPWGNGIGAHLIRPQVVGVCARGEA